ncbi:MAG TPA: secretin N-terminal domain-containing protein [Candidatus Saccharimonadales bacterium]|nr:secretin N-terminal domain-containing protein [Candidatus Saccharimonadales bacterium]
MRRLVWLGWAVAALALGAAGAAADEARFTLDYKGARVEDVVRALTAQAGLGMVTSGSLPGTVSLHLRDVTFEEAMRHLADATGICWARHGEVVTINPQSLQARTFPLRYVNAAAAREAILKLLGPQGTADVFTGTVKDDPSHTVSLSPSNALLVRDNEDRLAEIARVLAELDRKPRQVSIEARLVEVTLGRDEKMGLDWQIAAHASGAAMPFTFPFDKKAAGGNFTPTPNTNAVTGGATPQFPQGEVFPYANPSDFTFGRLSTSEFRVALDFLSSRTNTNLVSTPKITTLENRPAQILVGTVVPIAVYQNSQQTGVLMLSGYEEKQIGIRLSVNPRVCGDSTILMTVHPEVSEILEYRGQFNERPVTSTREATAEVMVRDGETMVIGGLVREMDTQTVSKVPLLGDIPLLGELFKHHTISKEKVDLVVFVTPHLIPE